MVGVYGLDVDISIEYVNEEKKAKVLKYKNKIYTIRSPKLSL